MCPQSVAHSSFLCYDSSPMDLNGATLSFFFQLSVTAEILLNGAWRTLYVYIAHSSTCAFICNTNQCYLSKIFFWGKGSLGWGEVFVWSWRCTAMSLLIFMDLVAALLFCSQWFLFLFSIILQSTSSREKAFQCSLLMFHWKENA